MIKSAVMAAGALVLAAPTAAQGPIINSVDVERFFAAYDRHGGSLDAETLQREYFDPATPGLSEFARLRRVSAESVARKLKADPALYVNARGCAAVIPRVRTRLEKALSELRRSYTDAKMAPLHIVVGHGRPVAVGNPTGAYIGLEALCAWTVPNPDVEDRFVHVIAHEYVHVQQPRAAQSEEQASVLLAALMEGGAEFVAELISGSVAYEHFAAATKGKELAIESQFLHDIDAPAMGSKWVFNGFGTPEEPGDLGYWVGYRICKAYYLKAKDKRQALRDIIELKDLHAILKRSGWKPGMVLASKVPPVKGRS
ncbi:MAG: DUF2268 domain-containing protein [Sphingopyxis sp.]|nr:DUF2268 domain-containing protein [Sphingopyxis sp.]